MIENRECHKLRVLGGSRDVYRAVLGVELHVAFEGRQSLDAQPARWQVNTPLTTDFFVLEKQRSFGHLDT